MVCDKLLGEAGRVDESSSKATNMTQMPSSQPLRLAHVLWPHTCSRTALGLAILIKSVVCG
eukprot:6211133-Pleurochrysis_carterae.AAC.4